MLHLPFILLIPELRNFYPIPEIGRMEARCTVWTPEKTIAVDLEPRMAKRAGFIRPADRACPICGWMSLTVGYIWSDALRVCGGVGWRCPYHVLFRIRRGGGVKFKELRCTWQHAPWQVLTVVDGRVELQGCSAGAPPSCVFVEDCSDWVPTYL